jgi:hypothetical protein
MRMVKTRANASEINKAPNEIRYLWVINFKDSGHGKLTPTVAMTYQTLDKIDPDVVDKFRVVDLKENKVYDIKPELLPTIKEEWRENYFNPSWEPTWFRTW